MRVRSSSHRTLAVSCLQKNTTLGRCGRIVLIFIMVALLIESLRPRLVYDFSQGVVKLPPARGSGSVVGVTGACVCDGSGVKRPGDRLGDRPGLLRLPLRSALLLLACARAGNQDQRRQEPPRQVPEGGHYPVGQALRMAAMAARRSETFIGAKHRARLARMDTPVAIKATARELACLIYLMVTEGQEYVEQGIGAYEKRRLNRKFAPCLSALRIHPLGVDCVRKMASGSILHVVCVCINRIGTVRSSRPPSPKARVPTRPENPRRGKTEPNAVNRLGTCYSRASKSDPSEAR